MSLSDYEKEVLQSLEQQFEPKVEREQTSLPVSPKPVKNSLVSPRKVVISVFLVLFGLVLLLVGVHYGIGWGTLIGIGGFLVILCGVVLPFGFSKYRRATKH